ncbi:hypothetical protein WME89_51800 [Sorangium sp. So ce321]|uniref:hypothetical protein n=1 Tax=Sorangium sp. So ce321 TaxID=3133300 RepID=UPI003F62A8ED
MKKHNIIRIHAAVALWGSCASMGDARAAEGADVSWNNLVEVGASDGGIARGPGSGWHAGASSVERIEAGDGFVEFSTNEADLYKAAGLSHGDDSQGYADIDHAIFLRGDGGLEIFEQGYGQSFFGMYEAGASRRTPAAEARRLSAAPAPSRSPASHPASEPGWAVGPPRAFAYNAADVPSGPDVPAQASAASEQVSPAPASPTAGQPPQPGADPARPAASRDAHDAGADADADELPPGERASTLFLVVVAFLSAAADLGTKAWAHAQLSGFDGKRGGSKTLTIIPPPSLHSLLMSS